MLDAKQIIGEELTPTKDGERLAMHFLQESTPRTAGVEIDVRALAPEDIVSSFVNAFLHTLQEHGWNERQLKRIRWVAKFDSEAARLVELVELYFSAPSHGQRVAARAPSSSR